MLSYSQFFHTYYTVEPVCVQFNTNLCACIIFSFLHCKNVYVKIPYLVQCTWTTNTIPHDLTSVPVLAIQNELSQVSGMEMCWSHGNVLVLYVINFMCNTRAANPLMHLSVVIYQWLSSDLSVAFVFWQKQSTQRICFFVFFFSFLLNQVLSVKWKRKNPTRHFHHIPVSTWTKKSTFAILHAFWLIKKLLQLINFHD